jgi:hypothetical protein
MTGILANISFFRVGILRSTQKQRSAERSGANDNRK